MKVTGSTSSSTCGNVNDVVGGRKTLESIVSNETSSGAVLVNIDTDDAVTFDDESLPFKSSEESDDETEEEESDEEDWSSEEEEYDAEDAELDEGLAERLRILADARALKSLAEAFLKPEIGVKTNGLMGRNYYDRPSAPVQMEDEDADEVVDILEDALMLKKAAAQWLHPEVGVTESAPESFGRNYFNRASAPETEDVHEAEERARILSDAVALKKSVVDWTHPEIGVVTSDATACGRNYFTRFSADEMEEDEYADERAECLEEAAALKKAAVDYMHPEVGVTSCDANAFGRNYFSRYSAPTTEDAEEAEEHARILADSLAMKKLAIDYRHPELGVVSCDATGTIATLRGNACARNYFNRASAPETESQEEAEEHARILADAAALKKSAVDYTHPEVGVTTADCNAFGRNYFNRYSAFPTEEDEFADERAEILEEAAALKKSAADWLHPEVGITESAPESFGRNYFNRFSADEVEDLADAVESARVFAEIAALKKSAVDFLHPEIGVSTSDATACGRNYFNRYSAPEVEDEEFAEERARVLAEAASLKKSAADYMHPEVAVSTTDATAFGRNYFNRFSAPETEDNEFADERARILSDAVALEKSAVDYMHPENPVVEVDANAFGRNYFSRYSAPQAEAPKKEASPEQGESLESLAAAVKGANLPSTKSTKLSSADGDFTEKKKSPSSVNLFGLGEAF